MELNRIPIKHIARLAGTVDGAVAGRAGRNTK